MPAGGDLTGMYPNPAIKAGAVGADALAAAPVARVLIGGQSVASGGGTPLLTLSTEDVDNAGMVDLTSDNKHIKIVRSGIYLVQGGFVWPTAADSTARRLSIGVQTGNGGALLADDQRANLANNSVDQQVTWVGHLDAGNRSASRPTSTAAAR